MELGCLRIATVIPGRWSDPYTLGDGGVDESAIA
jgi:hypothetical protein